MRVTSLTLYREPRHFDWGYISKVPFFISVTLWWLSFFSKVQLVQASPHVRPVIFWRVGTSSTWAGGIKISSTENEISWSWGTSLDKFPVQFLRYLILTSLRNKTLWKHYGNLTSCFSNYRCVFIKAESLLHCSSNSGLLFRRGCINAFSWKCLYPIQSQFTTKIYTSFFYSTDVL